MKKIVLAALVSTIVALGSTDVALASRGGQVSVQEQVSSAGPMSFQMFCAMNPAECRGGGASKIALNQETLDTLKRINGRVNRAIRPKLDSVYMQVWRVNPSTGDCKSYVVSKRHELIKAGLPASALRIAYVKTRSGQGHAVLVVKTAQGDLALDSLTGEIKLFKETGYRLVAISQADPRRWS